MFGQSLVSSDARPTPQAAVAHICHHHSPFLPINLSLPLISLDVTLTMHRQLWPRPSNYFGQLPKLRGCHGILFKCHRVIRQRRPVSGFSQLSLNPRLLKKKC
jgi:hypothetical protein